jgi:hypothetical protein
MKIVSLIARLLLGVTFLIFGLNGFLHFIPMQLPTGLAGQFLIALSASHYMAVVYLFQLIPAILLLINRYVPLALVLLAPVIVNILLFHVFMSPAGLPLIILVSVFWILTAMSVRPVFAGLLRQEVTVG